MVKYTVKKNQKGRNKTIKRIGGGSDMLSSVYRMVAGLPPDKHEPEEPLSKEPLSEGPLSEGLAKPNIIQETVHIVHEPLIQLPSDESPQEQDGSQIHHDLQESPVTLHDDSQGQHDDSQEQHDDLQRHDSESREQHDESSMVLQDSQTHMNKLNSKSISIKLSSENGKLPFEIIMDKDKKFIWLKISHGIQEIRDNTFDSSEETLHKLVSS